MILILKMINPSGGIISLSLVVGVYCYEKKYIKLKLSPHLIKCDFLDPICLSFILAFLRVILILLVFLRNNYMKILPFVRLQATKKEESLL